MSSPQSSPIMLDLAVNHDLLNSNFNSYRLSSNVLPIELQSLDSNVAEYHLPHHLYSFLHVSFAARINYLHQDPNHENVMFFVTKNGAINSVSSHHPVNGVLNKPTTVWNLPVDEKLNEEETPQDVNKRVELISLSFPSAEIALVVNGDANLFILSTPNRLTCQQWTVLSQIQLSITEKPIEILCSHIWTSNTSNDTQIDLICSHVEKREDENEKDRFVCILNWLTLKEINSKEQTFWTLKRTRQLKGESLPFYVALDGNHRDILCLISEKQFQFIYDSEKEIEPHLDENEMKLEEEKEETTREDDAKRMTYNFHQTLEDITVFSKVDSSLNKNDFHVQFSASHIEVKLKDKLLLEGELEHLIDVDSSTWTLQKQNEYQMFEIVLCKVDAGSIWERLIKDDKNGVEVAKTDIMQQMLESNKVIDTETFNANEYEECDLVESVATFVRLNGNTHRATHMIYLGGHQWILTIPTIKPSFNSPVYNELPCFVIRHDVDAIVWRPESLVSNENQLKASHVGTFSAFAYVHAGKQNKKFTVAANDFSFIAIADGSKHVYIYKQSCPVLSGELRNRKTGKEMPTVANQYVVNLNECQEILGMRANNDGIFVLTSNRVILIRVT